MRQSLMEYSLSAALPVYFIWKASLSTSLAGFMIRYHVHDRGCLLSMAVYCRIDGCLLSHFKSLLHACMHHPSEIRIHTLI